MFYFLDRLTLIICTGTVCFVSTCCCGNANNTSESVCICNTGNESSVLTQLISVIVNNVSAKLNVFTPSRR